MKRAGFKSTKREASLFRVTYLLFLYHKIKFGYILSLRLERFSQFSFCLFLVSQNRSEQGRRRGPPAANARVRRADVVVGQSPFDAGSLQSLHRIVLERAASLRHQPEAVRGRGAGPLCRPPVAAEKRGFAEAERPHQASEVCCSRNDFS